jgi:nitrogen fixation/metabolism regulation signal transduction histidine kinase
LALPGFLISAVLIWQRSWILGLRLAIIVAEVLVWWSLASLLLSCVRRPLQVLANMVAALRHEDYSFRARAMFTNDALGHLLDELNGLADLLSEQRLRAIEATALLKRVVDEIDIPLFAFDPDNILRLVNPAGERLLQQPASQLIGRAAVELGLGECCTSKSGTLISLNCSGPEQRWLLRRSTFRQKGVAHTLVVLSDVSRALRQEEHRAWQRLIRVLGHELNNSLAPIKSIAGSLSERARSAALSDDERRDFEYGLGIIEGRAGSLNRFLQAYRRLAQLPPPALRQVELGPLVTRVAGLETGVKVKVVSGPSVVLMIDPDQIEQVLINLLKNATDAALEYASLPGDGHQPEVAVSWSADDSQAFVTVQDNGGGLVNPTNTFVPFYTTKPSGTGIGLVLSRQIVEAHGGSLTVADRKDHCGCEARVALPRAIPGS